jgi:hypothetical protein
VPCAPAGLWVGLGRSRPAPTHQAPACATVRAQVSTVFMSAGQGIMYVCAGLYSVYKCRTVQHACLCRSAKGTGLQDSSTDERYICTHEHVHPLSCTLQLSNAIRQLFFIQHGPGQLCMRCASLHLLLLMRAAMLLMLLMSSWHVESDLLIRRTKTLYPVCWQCGSKCQHMAWLHVYAHAAAGPTCRPNACPNTCSAHVSAQTELAIIAAACSPA